MIDKNKVEFFLFRNTLKLLKFLGLDKSRKTAVLIGSFFYFFIPVRKKVTIENLSKAFPEKSQREIKKLARKNYQNIAITFFELMSLPYLNVEDMQNQVEFVNESLINEKLNKGDGFIIFTGHLGSWEFVMISLAVYFKKGLSILAKPQRNPYITKWLLETRERFGSKMIDLGINVRSFYKALKDKEIVGAAGDQRGHKDNPRFMFFNQPTALYTGTEAIALRTNSCVILTACIRQSDYKYKCYMEELDYSDLQGSEEEKIYELTQRYISFIEKYVRMNPEQYFWMHKIWKY